MSDARRVGCFIEEEKKKEKETIKVGDLVCFIHDENDVGMVLKYSSEEEKDRVRWTVRWFYNFVDGEWKTQPYVESWILYPNDPMIIEKVHTAEEEKKYVLIRH